MNELLRIVIFFCVGVFNTAFDFVLWHTFSKIFANNGLIKQLCTKFKTNHHTIAHICSFAITVFVSFFLNLNFTYNDKGGFTGQKMIGFFIVSIFFWFITTICLHCLTTSNFFQKLINTFGLIESSFSKQQSKLVLYWPSIAKIVTTLISMVGNYIGYSIIFSILK